MADISQIKITGLNNNNPYDIVDANAARANDLGGLKFAQGNNHELLVTHENNTITAATNSTLADIADAIGDLADAWEAAVTSAPTPDDSDTSSGVFVCTVTYNSNTRTATLGATSEEIYSKLTDGIPVIAYETLYGEAAGGGEMTSHYLCLGAECEINTEGITFYFMSAFSQGESLEFYAATSSSYPTYTQPNL